MITSSLIKKCVMKRDIYRRYIQTFYCILLQIYVQTIPNCRKMCHGWTPTSGFSISDSPFLYFPRFPSSFLTIVYIWKLLVITFSSDKIFGLKEDTTVCIKSCLVLSYLPSMEFFFYFLFFLFIYLFIFCAMICNTMCIVCLKRLMLIHLVMKFTGFMGPKCYYPVLRCHF